MTIQKLIERNDRDERRLADYIAKLRPHSGTRAYIGEFERQIANIRRSSAILRAAS